MKKLTQILNETDINKYKTWYHVTNYYQGANFIAQPKIPLGSRLPREDKHTPRISVATHWRNAIYMLVVIKRSKIWYVYETHETPIDPVSYREKLIKEKKIRSNSSLFNSPDAKLGVEAWFLKPTAFKLAGVVDLGQENYLKILLAMGFSDGGIDYKKLKLKSATQYFKEEAEEKRKQKILYPDIY